MMHSAVIVIVLLVQSPNRPQSATGVTTGDAFDRTQQDKLQKTLEMQNEKEMSAGAKKAPPLSAHDAAVITEMESQLEKLKTALQKRSFKDVESLPGKIIGGIRFFIPEMEPKQAAAASDLDATFGKVAPVCAAVIKGLREGSVNLTQARMVVNDLRSIQLAAKGRK